MHTLLSLLLLGLSAAPLGPELQLDRVDPDRMAIFETLTYYFHGYELNDTSALNRAYHSEAMFTMVDGSNGSCRYLPYAEYRAAIAAHPAKRYERALRLRQLQVSGNVASVHAVIEVAALGQRIHDFLILLRSQGRWTIVSRTSLKEYASFGSDQSGPMLQARKLRLAEQEARDAVRQHIALRDESPSAFLQAFGDHASVSFVDPRHDQIVRWPLAQYAAQRELPTFRARRRCQLAAIEVLGQVAVAKIRMRIPDYECEVVDYWTLVRESHGWRIIHKATYKPPRALAVIP